VAVTTRRIRACVIAGLALVASGCPDREPTLVVDVLTNYRPGVDFDGVVVSVHRGDDTMATGVPVQTSARASVEPRAGTPTPLRAAEVVGLAPASYLVLVRLYSAEREVGQGRALVTTGEGAISVTVFVTVECDGVVCAAPTSACLAGRCVDPRCTLEAPEFCPPEECASDAMCAAAGPDCLVGVCLGRACVDFADDSRCGGGRCDPVSGCEEAPDAGPGDAGGLDAGGADGGVDAGVDAGSPTPAFTSVAAGGLHTCAVSVDREVWCWGANGSGQLGDGTTTDRPVPRPVPGLSGVEQLALGRVHTCARSGGEVRCWGDSDFGQAGSAAMTTVTSPRLVAGTDEASALVAGDSHNCVLTVSDTVRCWGRGDAGQLGNGSTLLRQPAPSNMTGASAVERLAAGQLHTCVVVAGAPRCTGLNFEGQLGDDTRSSRDTLVDMVGVPADGRGLALGFGHTCLVRGRMDLVFCAGAHDRGQLGDGAPVTRRLTVVQAMGLTGVRELTTGNNHNCAVTGSGVLCWGDNAMGQLGDGTTDDRSVPTPIPAAAGLSGLSAGGDHTCGVDAGGRVLCWGRNDQGQLGDGTTTPRSTPTPVR